MRAARFSQRPDATVRDRAREARSLVTQPGEADQSPTSNIHPSGFDALMLNTLAATTVTGYSSTHTCSSLTGTDSHRLGAGDRGKGDAPRLTVASQERRLRIG